VQFDDLAEAAIPVHLVAFDLNEQREVLLTDGPATDAVAASASIPGCVAARQNRPEAQADAEPRQVRLDQVIADHLPARRRAAPGRELSLTISPNWAR
jgi:predicted acylesterase/phospholipase RssA